ncbi:ferredoxin family protein [Candidatus Altiarchaeota archaeon]
MPPIVDEKKCTGCGACISVCPASPPVFELVEKEGGNKSVVKNPAACIECGACVASCPVEAIKLGEVK